jgi:hypothetical protein
MTTITRNSSTALVVSGSFAPLLRTVAFDGTQAGHPLFTALAFLAQLAHQRLPARPQAPLNLVPGAWRLPAALTHGLGLVLALVGGFGLLAKLGIT